MNIDLQSNPKVQAYNIAVQFLAEFSIESGISGKQHAGILSRWAQHCAENDLDKVQRYNGFIAIENGSALRQRLEKAGILAAKSAAIAQEYA